MRRRTFLKRSSLTVGAGLAGLPGLPGLPGPSRTAGADPGPADPSGEFPDLVIGRGEPREALQKALTAAGGMGRFVKDGDTVALKPNAAFMAPPHWGATTHPEVVRAAADLCLEAGARRVLVVDHTLAPPERCFNRCGLSEALAGVKEIKLVALEEERVFRPMQVPAPLALTETAVANVALKADVLINLPSAKSHSATGVSFGMKNLMGLIWDRHLFHAEIDLHMGIADLASVIRPHLTILDAIYLLQTGGPSGPGDIESYGAIVVGTDPVAIDAYATGLTAWNHRTLLPEHVAYIRHAAGKGLGRMELSGLRIEEIA